MPNLAKKEKHVGKAKNCIFTQRLSSPVGFPDLFNVREINCSQGKPLLFGFVVVRNNFLQSMRKNPEKQNRKVSKLEFSMILFPCVNRGIAFPLPWRPLDKKNLLSPYNKVFSKVPELESGVFEVVLWKNTFQLQG